MSIKDCCPGQRPLWDWERRSRDKTDCPQTFVWWLRVKRNISAKDIPPKKWGIPATTQTSQAWSTGARKRCPHIIWLWKQWIWHSAWDCGMLETETSSKTGCTQTLTPRYSPWAPVEGRWLGGVLEAYRGQTEAYGLGERDRRHSPFSLYKQQVGAIWAFFSPTPTRPNLNLNWYGEHCCNPTHSTPPKPESLSQWTARPAHIAIFLGKLSESMGPRQVLIGIGVLWDFCWQALASAVAPNQNLH